MKIGAFIAIVFGIIIISSVVAFSLDFGMIFEMLFAAAFLYNGLKTFRSFRGENLGSLIFAIILILDIFKVFGPWNFWQLFFMMIGSFLIGWGIIEIIKKSIIKKENNYSSKKSLLIKRPDHEIDECNLEIDSNLTKIILMKTINDKNGLLASLNFDKSSFSGQLNYDLNNRKGSLKARSKARSGVSSVISKARLEVEIPQNILLKISANLDGLDGIFDFSSLKLDSAKFKTNLTRLTIIPSRITDSRIDINCDVTTLTLRIPKETSLVISQRGEMNWNNYNNLLIKDNKFYSKNIDSADVRCHVFLNSDMSKLNIQWI